jgi:hypothetical protein
MRTAAPIAARADSVSARSSQIVKVRGIDRNRGSGFIPGPLNVYNGQNA